MYPQLKNLGPSRIVGGSSSRTVIFFPFTTVTGFVGLAATGLLQNYCYAKSTTGKRKESFITTPT